jgi:DNA-binding NarL/FixJ family response regulator
MVNKKRVIIVDDHDMFREGLKALLNNTKTIEVVATASGGKEYLDILKQYNPDAVLMDVSMPEMGGIEATKLSLAGKPDLKILALSMFGDEENYYKMVSAGVKGFVLKTAPVSELEKAILAVSDNGNYFSNELLRQIITRMADKSLKAEANDKILSSLTNREIEVIKLVAAGLSNEDIADKLNISIPTVKSHRSNILSKTSCTNSSSLVMFAIKNKLVDVE